MLRSEDNKVLLINKTSSIDIILFFSWLVDVTSWDIIDDDRSDI